MKPFRQEIASNPYPGHYVPPFNEDDGVEGDEQMTAGLWKKLPIYLQESDSDITVDITLPGLKREDFQVSADQGVITIADIRQNIEHKIAEKTRRPSFQPPACFIRKVSLPDSADPEFSSAQYADGVLRIVMAKCSSRTEVKSCRIIVY
jgi:HSP20 family molecular chaperone IbpA